MDSHDFTAQLDEYRELVRPLLLGALPAREPRKYLYGLIESHLAHSGKGLRPALCIATCQAFDGDARSALPTAAALEMLHNAFLIHDDIEDGSEYRRDQRTLYREHGVPLAINAGDAMQALSLQMVRKAAQQFDQHAAFRLLEEFDHMLAESLEGQALEMGWVRDNCCTLSERDYLQMTLKKTCWYSFIHPCRIGALIARPERDDLPRFDRFGLFIGIAFQIQDDVLNLIGQQARYGKEIDGDLWEGKRTLMLLHLFRSLPGRDADRLSSILAKSRAARLPRDIAWIGDQILRHGSMDYARDAAREFARAAAAEFEEAFAGTPASRHKDFLHALIDFAVAREV